MNKGSQLNKESGVRSQMNKGSQLNKESGSQMNKGSPAEQGVRGLK